MQIVAPRELKILTVKKMLPNGVCLVASFSVPDHLGPPLTKGKVRALLFVGGGVIVPKDGGSQVTFLTQARAQGRSGVSFASVLRAASAVCVSRPTVVGGGGGLEALFDRSLRFIAPVSRSLTSAGSFRGRSWCVATRRLRVPPPCLRSPDLQSSEARSTLSGFAAALSAPRRWSPSRSRSRSPPPATTWSRGRSKLLAIARSQSASEKHTFCDFLRGRGRRETGFGAVLLAVPDHRGRG